MWCLRPAPDGCSARARLPQGSKRGTIAAHPTQAGVGAGARKDTFKWDAFILAGDPKVQGKAMRAS
jgi:hypothetical protein